jgi:hypothetical protein
MRGLKNEMEERYFPEDGMMELRKTTPKQFIRVNK